MRTKPPCTNYKFVRVKKDTVARPVKLAPNFKTRRYDMSRVYNTYCDTRDDIYIAMGDAGLSEGLFKQLHAEQGKDAVAYVIRKQLGKEPIFFDEALDQIIKEVNNEYS